MFGPGVVADGHLDVIIANWGSANQLLLNGGSGDFSLDAVFEGSSSTYAVDCGDVDGDGDADLVFGNWDAANELLINVGSGRFSKSTTFPGGGAYTFATVLGDLDGDGSIDIFVGQLVQSALCPVSYDTAPSARLLGLRPLPLAPEYSQKQLGSWLLPQQLASARHTKIRSPRSTTTRSATATAQTSCF